MKKLILLMTLICTMQVNAQPNIFKHANTASGKRSNTQTSNNVENKVSNSTSFQTSNISPSSLTYDTWETKSGNNYTTYVRNRDGMVTETSHIKCTCLNGVCAVCGGTGGFYTPCLSCSGTRRCSFCGGAGTQASTRTYRYIDEYYSDGVFALHVTSSSAGPSVYSGGIGYIYNTYGNSNGIRDGGSYYTFGGETVSGVKTSTFRLSKDYKKFWTDNGTEYHLISKQEYDRISKDVSRANNGRVSSYGGSNNGGSYSNGGSNTRSRSGGSSTYITCKYCSGTGRCSSCNGKGVKFNGYAGHDDTCPGCNGSGRCKICYGTGRL